MGAYSRLGAYSSWALIRGWALIRINTVVMILQLFLSFFHCPNELKKMHQCISQP